MAVWYKDEKLNTRTREYRSRDAFEKEAAKAAEYGWEIATAVDRAEIAVGQLAQQPRALQGCTTAWVARFYKPTPHVVATYRRTAT